MGLPNLTIEKIWLPIVRAWLETYFSSREVIYLVIDRTTWARTNLLVISVVWDKRAFPIYFQLLPKLGSSNLDEQKAALSSALPIFINYKICVLGDREFCSIKLANWLREQGVYFCLSLKKNEFVEVKNEIWLTLNELGLLPGISGFLQGVRVTKQQGFARFNVVYKWQRKILGIAPKEGWFILTNFASASSALAAYKKRFDIEGMFRDFKKGGYNLEDTNVSGERLIKLVLLIAIAYTSATIQGQQIKHKGIQNYVGRVKEYGRAERRHSSFYIGLSGQDWVDFRESCTDLVTKLMKLNRNKQKYYQRGLRAIELILTAS